MSEYYTKIFVDIAIEHEELLNIVSRFCSGNVDLFTVEVDGFEIDILKNKEAEYISDSNDFLSFEFILEIVNVTQKPFSEYLSFCAALMNLLHKQKARVVAACDWEEELPGKGKLGMEIAQ